MIKSGGLGFAPWLWQKSMGSVPGAGWAVCAAPGSTWVGSDFKTDAVITWFCLPSPFCPLPDWEGSLHGDTWVGTVQPDYLCSRMALYKVIEVSRVALFSLPGTLGRSGSVLLFTWCLFCKTIGCITNTEWEFALFWRVSVYCYVDLAEWSVLSNKIFL